MRRAERGAKIFGVFRVKNHDFTPKNHIFSNCGGRRENCWGISCKKSWFYAKKSGFFSNFRGGGGVHLPLDPTMPWTMQWTYIYWMMLSDIWLIDYTMDIHLLDDAQWHLTYRLYNGHTFIGWCSTFPELE